MPLLRITPTVLTAILTVANGGCSFVFVDGPPAAHAKMPFFDCSTSVALPTIDLVLGAAAGIPLVAQLSDGSTGGSQREAVIVAAGEAALFAASAVYGYTKTGQCREAKAALLDRMMRNPPPPAYGPGPGFPGPYQPPPAYDPWLAPPPGAFATPPGAAPPPPSTAPTPWGPAPAGPGVAAPTSSPPPASPSPPPPAKVEP